MAISFDNVTHAYVRGTDVVRDVGFRVERGEVACLLGPSGCGKSTLLRLAAGLEVLDRGRIAIAGRPVADGAGRLHVPPERRRAGLMFQDYALFPHLTVFENIAFGVPEGRRDERHRVGEALRRWGMGGLADCYPHTLSGGQQQRCALLRALAPRPDVLLLDEPFSGLDVVLRAQVREETLDLLQESGVPTVIVTHDPDEAMYMADRLLVMRDGAIVQHGRPDDIYLHPVDPFVVTLFGPVNRLLGRVRDGRVASPLGDVAAPRLAEGAAAEVLIRPEAIAVDVAGIVAATAGAVGRVVSARLLGRASDISLEVAGMPEPVRALVPGVVLPPPGSALHVFLDPAHAFAFAAPLGVHCPAEVAQPVAAAAYG